MKNNKKLVSALIVAALAIVFNIILGFLMRYIHGWHSLIFLLQNTMALLAAWVVYRKFIVKETVALPIIAVASVVSAVVLLLVDSPFLRLASAVGTLVSSKFIFDAFYLILKFLVLTAISIPALYWFEKDTIKKAYNAVFKPVQVKDVPDLDSLQQRILQSLKPLLKTPLTAVLCDAEEMIITQNGDTYRIVGIVHSQNSYGAMVRTDFAVTAVYGGEQWSVGQVKLGANAAKAYATNFVLNYILISIFVAIMGVLGYFILTSIV